MNNFMSLLDPFHSSTKCRFFAHAAALIQERRKGLGGRGEGGQLGMKQKASLTL